MRWAAIALFVLGGVFYTASVFSTLWNQFQLDSAAPAHLIELTTAKEGDYYIPKLIYEYSVNGTLVRGASLLHTVDGRNPYVLEPALKAMAEQSWTVYFDSSDPSRSALEKPFPTSDLIKALALFAAAAYFAFLTKSGISVQNGNH